MKRLIVGLLLVYVMSAQNPNTAVFPGAVATDTDLLVQNNSAQTTLDGAIDDSTLAINLTSAAEFTFPGVITVGTERIKVCSKSGNTVTVCTSGRGFDGSTAATHADHLNVYGYLTKYEHNQLAAEMKATQTALGANLTNVLNQNTSGKAATAGNADTVTHGLYTTDKYGTSPAALLATKASGADPTTDNCVKWLAGGAIGDAGAACGSGGGATGVTQTTEFTAANALSVSAGASGRAQVQTPLHVDPVTGALSTPGIDTPSEIDWKWEGGVIAAPGTANYTRMAVLPTGVPGWRTYGGAEKTAASTDQLTWIRSVTLLDPVAGDSGRVQLMFPTAVTITRVTCNTLTATSTATVNFEERGETTPGTTGTAVLSADLVADTNMQTSCASGCDVNTITNAGIAARVPLAFTISAVANAPAEVTCHIDGTVD